jgi:hypothetical protein
LQSAAARFIIMMAPDGDVEPKKNEKKPFKIDYQNLVPKLNLDCFALKLALPAAVRESSV